MIITDYLVRIKFYLEIYIIALSYVIKLDIVKLYIRYKLLRKGYSKDTIELTIFRYTKNLRYKQQQINKMCNRIIYDEIAKLSDRTGIPQWEIRASISRKYGIDI